MIAFLAGLLAFGTLWFWLFSFLVFCAITALVENDEGVWATIVFIGTVLSLNFLSKIPVLDYVKANPIHTAMYVGIYFGAGVVWSFVKWGIFLKKRDLVYNNFRAEFLKDRKADTMTPELAAKFAESLSNNYKARELGVTATPLVAREHKADLTRWATYWPFSILGTLLNDVVRRTWDFIYEALQSSYQRMVDAIMKNTSEDAKLVEQYKAQQAAAGAGDTGSRRNR